MVNRQAAASPPTSRGEDTGQGTRAVVDRAFTLLEAWQNRADVLGVSELARRTRLPKTTSHRLVGILEIAGLIERVAGGYQLADRLHGLSDRLSASYPRELRDVVLPFLQDLYELSHETVHLAVLDGTEVVCIEKIYGHRRTPVKSSIGGLLPTHSTALGKVLLAYSPEPTRRRALGSTLRSYTAATVTQPLRLNAELRAVLRNGLGVDRRETHPEVTCVAAPVLDPRGRSVAAISISGPTHRFDPTAVIQPLRRAARAASVALAGPGPAQRAA